MQQLCRVGGGPKGLSGHDDIAAPNELERLSDLLLEARSTFENTKKTNKEKAEKVNHIKESAAVFVQEAGIRMLGINSPVAPRKTKTVDLQAGGGDGNEMKALAAVTEESPPGGGGGRGKDKKPRSTQKRKREESEDHESLQETLLKKLDNTERFLQDYLKDLAEQDKKAAEYKAVLEERIKEQDDADKKETQATQRLIAMSLQMATKTLAVLESKGFLQAPGLEQVNYYEALAGRTVAEDAFVWLHKDASYHAIDLVITQDDTQIIKRFNDRLSKLLAIVSPHFLCLMENGHKGK